MNRGPKGPGVMATEKAKDFKGTVQKLFKSMGKYKIQLIVIVIFAIASTIFSIVGPKILGNATTELFNGVISKLSGGAGIDFGKIASILTFLLGLYIISAIFSYIQGFIMTGISQKYTYELRKKVSIKINKLPMNYFDKKTHGEVLSIITNDIDTMSQSLNQSATQLITSIATIIGILVMMLSINVIMTIVALLILPIATLITMFIVKHSQRYFSDQQEYLGHVNGQIEEMYSGQNVIKVFNAEDKVVENFEKDNEKLCSSGWKSQFFSGMMHPIMNFIGNLGYVVVAILGGYYAIKGRITVGNIQSFISYTKNFTNPIAQLAQVSNMVQANDEFAIFSSQSKIDLVPFLAIERLALIELRLQLDVPLNYQEIEENEKKKRELDDIEYKKNKAKYEKKDDYFDEEEEVKVEPIKFSQDIGPLINPELSASSCQLLESLVIPLVNHEDDLNDTEILQYLDTLDSILNETVSIFSAVKGQRDCDRNELKCLFSLFAGWLRDAPFLCENTSTLNSLKSIISKLWWFPNEALQLIPAFTTWSESSNARPLMKASFNDLAKRLKEYSTPAESQAIDELISKVYLCK